jgi:hypothetical protein
VPLQLEECIQRAKNHVSDTQIRIKIRSIGEADRIVFHIETDLDAEQGLHGQGTMQRWQGTLTRIRGKVWSSRPVNATHEFVTFFVSGSCMGLLVFAWAIYYPRYTWLDMCFAFGVIMLVIALISRAWRMRNRERRVIMQHLRHLLTS